MNQFFAEFFGTAMILDADAKLAVFSTIPSIRSYWYNVLTEVIGTYILALAALAAGMFALFGENI